MRSSESVPRIGVVLQGPTVSVGRHGGTMHTPSEESVTFDCRPLISEYHQICKRLDVDLIFSTWNDQVVDGLDCSIIAGPASLPQILPGRLHAEPSKFLQILSSQRGVDALIDKGVDIVIKIRADLKIDVESLIADIRARTEFERDEFHVPFMDPQKPWSVQDFYFVAHAQTAKRVFNEYLALPEFHAHVHQDLFWKFGLSLCGGTQLRLFFPLFGKPWTQMQGDTALRIYRVFHPLSKSTWQSMTWRGQKISSEGVEASEQLSFIESDEVSDQKLLWAMRKYLFLNLTGFFAQLATGFFTDYSRYVDVENASGRKANRVHVLLGWLQRCFVFPAVKRFGNFA